MPLCVKWLNRGFVQTIYINNTLVVLLDNFVATYIAICWHTYEVNLFWADTNLGVTKIVKSPIISKHFSDSYTCLTI